MNATMLLVFLTGSNAVTQAPQADFKAPRIEVRTETRDGKAFSYLLYNRVYMGRQYRKSKDEPELNLLPTTYFHDKGPIGVILKDPERFPAKGAPPVAVLGMDVGTLAAYARPGQTFHFTERVPTFVKLSLPDKGEKRYFTFVQDALDRGVNLKIFEGEPRAMIEKHGKENFYQVIVIETYKLPVVEVHKELMTREAIRMLMSKCREDGIVAFHTSNRYYDLVPIIASAANDLKLACVVGRSEGSNRDGKEDHRFSSDWVMVAGSPKHLAHLKTNEPDKLRWHAPTIIESGPVAEYPIDREYLWTDKGEQSFHGLFRSYPPIDKLYEPLNDIEDFLRDKLGVSISYNSGVDRTLRGVIRAWSAGSAAALNKNAPHKAK